MKQQYKILIENRQYTSWSFLDPSTNMKIVDVPELQQINPIEHKLFSRDVFTMYTTNDQPKLELINSFMSSASYFAGVLQLENNKTFGRTANHKRLLYKCVPDDKHLPTFLVPYDVKIGFSKLQKNKFVIFKYDHWTDKHPHGILIETIGDLDNLEAFYEYQLYCKSLHISITQFNNKTRDILNKKTASEYVEQIFHNPDYHIQDRRHNYVFTIDPLHSLDFDDGFGIQPMDDGSVKISIYIANVYFWLETLGLWNTFSKRVATIYLPDKRRPMLPTILSDTLCSLQQNEPRFALAMDIIVDARLNITDIQYTNVIIKVNKNYEYENPKMISKDNDYKQLLEITQKLDPSVENSHDLVSHWMVFMNSHTGKYMANHKIGIFRSANYIQSNLQNLKSYDIDDDTTRIINSWNNVSGQYLLYTDTANLQHELMGGKTYAQITSPIRRIIDLLNLIIISQHLCIIERPSTEALGFLNNWIREIDFINNSMRSIRKIQTDCDVLNRCFHNPEIMENIYSGILFDKTKKHDGKFSYMVYIKEIKLLTRFVSFVEYENYMKQPFKLYLFEDEDTSRKKIRLQIVE